MPSAGPNSANQASRKLEVLDLNLQGSHPIWYYYYYIDMYVINSKCSLNLIFFLLNRL